MKVRKWIQKATALMMVGLMIIGMSACTPLTSEIIHSFADMAGIKTA